MPSRQTVRIVYGPTGGRYPMMFGIAEALESKLQELGITIGQRIGISGGAMVAAGRSGKEDFRCWVRRCIKLTRTLKIWGSKTPSNICNLILHGGLLNSSTVLKEVFGELLHEPPTEPCYAVSWCKNEKKAVAFPMHNSPHAGKYLFASAAVPIAFSPVRIKNEDLPESVRSVLELKGEYSTFQDGGLSEVYPPELVGGEELPTIMVFIDPIPLCEADLKNQKSDMWDKLFGLKNKANLLALSARKKSNVQIFVVPQIEYFENYRVRFDLDLETALDMFDHGRVMTQHSFQLFLSFPEQLNAHNDHGKKDASQRLGGEHALTQVVPSENGEHQEGQTVPE